MRYIPLAGVVLSWSLLCAIAAADWRVAAAIVAGLLGFLAWMARAAAADDDDARRAPRATNCLMCGAPDPALPIPDHLNVGDVYVCDDAAACTRRLFLSAGGARR